MYRTGMYLRHLLELETNFGGIGRSDLRYGEWGKLNPVTMSFSV